jgi:hypothetical protein
MFRQGLIDDPEYDFQFVVTQCFRDNDRLGRIVDDLSYGLHVACSLACLWAVQAREVKRRR